MLVWTCLKNSCTGLSPEFSAMLATLRPAVSAATRAPPRPVAAYTSTAPNKALADGRPTGWRATGRGWSGSHVTRRLTGKAFSTDMTKLGQALPQAPRLRSPFLSAARASDAGLPISPKKKAASRGLLRSTGKNGLFDDLVQLAPGVTLGHLFQRDGLDLAGAAGAAEGLETGQTDFLGRFARRLQVVARVEL